MNRETNSSQSTDDLSAGVDVPRASTETEGFFRAPSTVENEAIYWLFQPRSAVGSVWEDARTTASTGLLHEWLQNDTANLRPRAGDVA